MSDVLSPSLALAYLAELQPGLQTAAVIGESGRVLVGAQPAAGAAAVSAARGSCSLTVSGSVALESLLRLDLANILADLGDCGAA